MSADVDGGFGQLQSDASNRPAFENSSLDPAGGCFGYFAFAAGTNGIGSIQRESSSVSLAKYPGLHKLTV